MPIVANILRNLGYSIRASYLFCLSILFKAWRSPLAAHRAKDMEVNEPATHRALDGEVNELVLVMLGYRPTAEAIEQALAQCHTTSPQTCLYIFKRYAERFHCYRKPDRGIVLTPTSLAIGWSVSQRGVRVHSALHSLRRYHSGLPISKETVTMHELLDYHYTKLPSTPKIPYDQSDCMMQCGAHGNMPMTRALLQIESTLADLFLEQGIEAGKLDVVRIIAEGYSNYLQPKALTAALRAAVWVASYPVLDLFIELFGADITQAMYVEVFNDMCELGVPAGLEVMLDRFNDRLIFKEGLTFNPRFVKKRERIVSLLHAAYGSKLIEQFPDWKIEV